MAFSKPSKFDAEDWAPFDGQPVLTHGSESSELPPYQPESVEFSSSLETSTPLEAPQLFYSVPLQSSAPSDSAPMSATPRLAQQIEPQSTGTVEATIPLLEERLMVNLHKRKVGEVVVRKEVETRIIQVPVRREKLIVEQVSPKYQQLAVIELGQTQDSNINVVESASAATLSTANTKFSSIQAAIEFLQSIAAKSEAELQEVQISLVSNDFNSSAAHQL